MLLVTSGDAPHLVRHRQLSRLLKKTNQTKKKQNQKNKHQNNTLVCGLSFRGFIGPFAPLSVREIPSRRVVVCRKSSVACLCTQAEFQRQWRSKEKASDKATGPGARHVNNLKAVICKNSQMQALKESQGFRGEYSPRQERGTRTGRRALPAWLSLPAHQGS